MDVETAVERLVAYLPDGGASLLAESGFSEGWSSVLSEVHPDWLAVDHADEHQQADLLLVYLREYYSQIGELRVAIAITRALVKSRLAEFGEEHPESLVELGMLGALADRAGRAADATQMLEQAYNGLRSIAGGRDLRLAAVASNLGLHCLRIGQYQRGEQLLEQAFRIQQDLAPETTGALAAQIGELLIRRQRPEEALPYLDEAWQRYVDDFGVSDRRTVARARTLAATLNMLGRGAESIPVLRVVLDAAIAEGDGEQRATVSFQLANALEAAGQREESIRLMNECIRWTRQNGDPHPDLPERLNVLSNMVLSRKRPEEAEGMLREALEAELRLHGEGSTEAAIRYAHLGFLCADQGRRDEAIGWLEPAASILRSNVGDHHFYTRQAVEHLVAMWVEMAREALARVERSYAKDILKRARILAIPVLGARHGLVQAIEEFRF